MHVEYILETTSWVSLYVDYTYPHYMLIIHMQSAEEKRTDKDICEGSGQKQLIYGGTVY